MRLGVIEREGAQRVVVVGDDEVAMLPEGVGDVVDIIAGGPDMLDDIRGRLGDYPRLGIEEVRFEAPLRRQPRDVLCTGWNYWDHFEEGKGLREAHEVEAPERPTFFTKGPDTIIGPSDDIAYDPELSSKWDYEAELALVFGRSGRSIAEEDALGHVFGYLLANDISQRDLQQAHGGQWLKGKSIDSTMPIGPWVVTAGEVDVGDLRLQCEVNGQILQDASTAQMAFPIPRLIAELTRGMTVRAGQLFLTGTPAGVGNARRPPMFLQAGDEVVTRAPGLGEMRNRLTFVPLSAPDGQVAESLPGGAS